MVELDNLNRQLLTHLQDGRKSFKKIADALGVSENTIKARIKRMETAGVLKISAFVDPDQIEGTQHVYIGMSLTKCDYGDVAKKISNIPHVMSVAIVTGRYDLILSVLLGQKHNLLEFISQRLNPVDEIERLETFIVYQGYNITVPAPTIEEAVVFDS